MTGRPRKATSKFKQDQELWWKLSPVKVKVIKWDRDCQMYHVNVPAWGGETHMFEHELSEEKPRYE